MAITPTFLPIGPGTPPGLGDLMPGTRTFRLVVPLALVALACGTAAAQRAGPPAGRKYALLVGVRQYDSADLRELDYAEADVAELARVFLDQGYRPEDVVLMTMARGAENVRRLPMRDRIRRELKLLLQDRRPADNVVVALAGHGVKPRGSKSSYFCPIDADPATLLPLEEFYKALEGCGAGFKLLLVDACRNDPLTKAARGRATVELESVTRHDLPEPPGGVAALFSCSAGEVAFENADLKHGVFFHFVIDGLRGGAARPSDGRVTLPLLEDYVKDNVERFVRDKYRVRQMPERLGREAGSMTLASIDRAPVSAVPSPRPVPPAAPPKTLTNSVGMTLALIPAGEFLMGSDGSDKDAGADEKPQHRVRITRPFYLGATEVTVGQFRRVAEAAGFKTEAERDGKGGYGWDEATKEFKLDPKYTWRSPGFAQTDKHPVVNVSWNDAVAFCNKLSERDGLEPYYRFGAGPPAEGDGYRLPTEAEWEYACRAGTTTRYWVGDDAETLAEVGNVADGTAKEMIPVLDAIAARDGFVFTASVGKYRANAFGLYDMHGNVVEWCGDGYDADYYGKSPIDDPSGTLKATDRVIRGGSWLIGPRDARSAHRFRFVPEFRIFSLGFRVARV